MSQFKDAELRKSMKWNEMSKTQVIHASELSNTLYLHSTSSRMGLQPESSVNIDEKTVSTHVIYTQARACTY